MTCAPIIAHLRKKCATFSDKIIDNQHQCVQLFFCTLDIGNKRTLDREQLNTLPDITKNANLHIIKFYPHESILNHKKKLMKYVCFLLVCLLAASCYTKPQPEPAPHYDASGTITGQDLAMCACCGGYIMKMSTNDSVYRFFSFPAGTTFDTTKFPISVNFNFTRTGVCASNFQYIALTKVVKTN